MKAFVLSTLRPGDRIALAGDLPPLVRNRDAELTVKVTRDPE